MKSWAWQPHTQGVSHLEVTLLTMSPWSLFLSDLFYFKRLFPSLFPRSGVEGQVSKGLSAFERRCVWRLCERVCAQTRVCMWEKEVSHSVITLLWCNLCSSLHNRYTRFIQASSCVQVKGYKGVIFLCFMSKSRHWARSLVAEMFSVSPVKLWFYLAFVCYIFWHGHSVVTVMDRVVE